MSKRKVRKDFNKSQPITVNVKGCSEDIKEQVLQAFFDVGPYWNTGCLILSPVDANSYTNLLHKVLGGTEVKSCVMWSGVVEGITPAEFFVMVYEEEPQGHPHAELMMAYAEDAKTHAEPWKLWQFKDCDVGWVKCTDSPVWCTRSEYRRKPKTRLVHGVEVPDLRFEPKINNRYYVVDISKRDYFSMYTFHGDNLDYLWTERGLCYEYTEAGKQAARMHAKAMLGIA